MRVGVRRRIVPQPIPLIPTLVSLHFVPCMHIATPYLLSFLQWERVTFSRLTKIYFIFSVLHCIIQVVFQVQAFVANAEAARFLNALIVQGNATDPGFTVYNGDLRMCENVPSTLDVTSCPIVWDGRTAASVVSGKLQYSSLSAEESQVTSSAAQSSSIVSPPTAPSSSLVSPSPVSSPAAISVGTTFLAAPLSTGSFSASSAAAIPSATIDPKVNLKDGSESEDEEGAEEESGSSSSDSSDGESDSESDEEEGAEEEEEEEEQPKPLVTFLFGKRDNLKDSKIRLSLDGNVTVNLEGVNGLNEVELSRKCLYTLNWPVDM